MNVPPVVERFVAAFGSATVSATVSATASIAFATVLAACASKPAAPTAGTPTATPVPVAVPAPSPSPSAPPPRANLATEALRLSDLFRGTPVVFATQQDGSLRATVPRKFSFDAGSTRVKPPLVAVLDRIAKSQAQTRNPIRVAAPADADGKVATLARDRAISLRDHLVGQGIAVTRLQIGPAPQSTDAVEVIVSDAAR
jgi:outer membrane protein OmpA-like peptidoglycan-associated protein